MFSLDHLVMGPLKGTPTNHHNNNDDDHNGGNCNRSSSSTLENDRSHNLKDRGGCNVEKSSDFSEEGYSAASEEDGAKNQQNGPPARRKKSRTRSTTSFKKPNGYLSLDDPSRESSYV